MKKQFISFKDINPNLRYINLLQCTQGFVEGPRQIYDYQLVYIHHGKGEILADGVRYSTLPGDLFFFSPGMLHAYYADADEPYLITGIHFDFTDNQRALQFPIGSFSPSKYDGELIPELVEFTDLDKFPQKMSFFADDKIRQLILSMLNEFKNSRIFSKEYIDGLLKVLLTVVARNLTVQGVIFDRAIENESVIDEVIKHIQEHFNEDVSNKAIAETFHFHPNYLNRLMVIYTGVSLRQYWIDTRIKIALDLLLHTKMSIGEVASRVGYSDIHYFCRIFKKKTGMSPGKVRLGVS